MSTTFHALVVREKDNHFSREIETRTTDDLPEGDVLIRVKYSSLNYKDALSATGNRGVTRNYPHTPGIDAAGIVEESHDSNFSHGDKVVVIGFDLGMNTAGGYGQYIRVPAGWVVKLPDGLTLRESMALGTAGFTAALSVYKLQQGGVLPEDGPVVVTGSTGGVGSVAVALLAKLGYAVTAVTGKADEEAYLKELGATEVAGRDALHDPAGRALLKPQWAGGIDTVGGPMLATLLKATKYDGVVTCCGLVASPKLETTVFPFILRGVSLLGVDSVECAIALKRKLWHKLATDWKLDGLNTLGRDVALANLEEEIQRILQGQQVGRVVVTLS